MGKQKQILTKILKDFEFYQGASTDLKEQYAINQIKVWFKRSKNKNDLIRRILNDIVLSETEIVFLLRIIFKKQKSI